MIGTVLGQVTGQLEKRFILNALFPTLVFVLAWVLAVAVGTDTGPLGPVERWENDSTGARVVIAIGVIAAVFLLANLLANRMQGVIRLFEGYGVRPRSLADVGRRRQLARARKLIDVATSSEDNAKREAAKNLFELSYPSFPQTLGKKNVAATRLGNILRSAEAYGASRYGIDSVRIWSRLYPLLPDALTTSMVSARTSMEFLLAVSFLAGIYAPLASLYLIGMNGPLVWTFSSLLGGTAIAVVTYHAAMQPAAIYGETIRSAVDLYRLELVKAMAKPLPKTMREETRTWRELHLLFDRGTEDPNWHYVPKPDK
ncbi:MAG: hypothetical protein ACJ76D_03395 [Solirubrobacterales bacterium]